MSKFSPDDSNEHFLKELEQEKIILSELEKEIIENSIKIEKEREKIKKTVSNNSQISHELEQEREILNELNKILSINKDEINKIKSDHAIKNHSVNRTLKELKQEREFLLQLNNSYEEIIEKLEATNISLEEKISNSLQKSKELEQEGMTQNEIIKEQTIKLTKKQSMIITLVIIGVVAISVSSFMFVTVVTGQQYKVENIGTMPTGYVIQNLRGDTIDTWLSWRVVSGAILHVGIVNAEKYPDKIPLIKEVILSEESIEIDDSLLHKGPKGTSSTYFVGWSGALNDASKQSTKFYIPSNLEVTESAQGEGDITIILTNERSGDGYSGYTKNIADESQNQILKASITIYDVDKLSSEGFKTILRHEFGHAIGLAHSTAPEDLMHPIIETNYPYISDCDISALTLLYDGGEKSEVTCEK